MKERKMVYAPITREDVAWVATAYSHLIAVSLVEKSKTITGEQFASLIRQTYDCERSAKNSLAAFFAQFGIETITRERRRDRVTWYAHTDVSLRTNAKVFDEWKEGGEQ